MMTAATTTNSTARDTIPPKERDTQNAWICLDYGASESFTRPKSSDAEIGPEGVAVQLGPPRLHHHGDTRGPIARKQARGAPFHLVDHNRPNGGHAVGQYENTDKKIHFAAQSQREFAHSGVNRRRSLSPPTPRRTGFRRFEGTCSHADEFPNRSVEISRESRSRHYTTTCQ